MFTSLLKRLVPVFLLCALSITLFPHAAMAKWKDKSGDLPGLVSTKSIVLIGLGTAGAVFLLAQLSKSGKASKAKAQASTSVKPSASTVSGSKLYAQSSNAKSVSVPRVALVVDVNAYGSKGIDSFQRNMSFKNKTLSVGLSLGL